MDRQTLALAEGISDEGDPYYLKKWTKAKNEKKKPPHNIVKHPVLFYIKKIFKIKLIVWLHLIV